MEKFIPNVAVFALLGLFAVTAVSHAAPVLGNYPNTSLPLSTDTTITPDAAPTSTTRINVSTSTNFKGKLEGNPTTGVLRVTNAHPAGIYTVTVKAFDSGGASVTKTFMLTVTTPVTCNPLTFAAATNFATAAQPVAVAVGDFNRDGEQDLVTANFAANVSILLGNGVGSFGAATNFAVGGQPNSVAVGDFNGDGKQDLATANGNTNNISILLGDGAGSFGPATNIGITVGNYPDFVAVGDFNGDGRQDLAVATYFGGVSILLGDGTGSFGPPTNFGGGSGRVSVAVGDFNGDGRQDLVTVSENGEGLYILLGDGTGNFGAPSSFPVSAYLRSVAVGDFNGDGRQDIATADPSTGNVWILRGDGAGSFSAATPFWDGSGPDGLAVGDFNGDGKQDLAVGDFQPTVSILLGDGAGNLGAATTFGVGPTSGGQAHSVAVGDFNGDGKQDLAVTNDSGNNVSILLRDCTTTPTSAVSRKTHGGAGSFNIDLPLTGLPGTLGVECRTGGATNDYQLVVTYPGTVTVNGNPQARVNSGSGAIGSGGVSNGGMVTVSGNTVTIPLTSVSNAEIKNVTLYGVNGGGNLVIPMGVLLGDTNGNGSVSASDIAQTKANSGQVLSASNFRTDLNVNGSINGSDVALVKSKAGTALP